MHASNPPTFQRHAVHLTTVHQRYDIRIFRKECCSLARSGWMVTLIVADGKRDETVSGVQIVDAGRSRSRLSRMLFGSLRVLRLALRMDGHIYHFHDPELIPAALILAWFGKSVIYDAHEDVSRQILTKPWLPRWVRRPVSAVFESLENFAVRRFSAAIGATPHIAARLCRLNSLSIAINNFPLRDEIESLEPNTPRMTTRDRVACYVGGITRIRGAIEMVSAMEHVDGRLILAGPIEDAALERELRALPGWSKVDYRGVVSRESVRKIFSESRLGLLPLLPAPNYLTSQPTKMFEYMSAGLPVIASDFPLWRCILGQHNRGILVPAGDVTALAAAIQELLDQPERCQDMGIRGLELVSTSHNWDAEQSKLIELYSRFGST